VLTVPLGPVSDISIEGGFGFLYFNVAVNFIAD